MTPPTPAAAKEGQPSSTSSSRDESKSESSNLPPEAAVFSFADLPDDLLLRILVLVDEPTRQFALHEVSEGGEIGFRKGAREKNQFFSQTSTLTLHLLNLKKNSPTTKTKKQHRSAAPGAPWRPAPRRSPSSTPTSSSTAPLWPRPRTPPREGSSAASGSASAGAAAAQAAGPRAAAAAASSAASLPVRALAAPRSQTIRPPLCTAGAAAAAAAAAGVGGSPRAATSPRHSAARARRRRRARGSNSCNERGRWAEATPSEAEGTRTRKRGCGWTRRRCAGGCA